MCRAPVEVEIDAVAVLRVGVLEIVGEASRGGELVAGRRIEISVGAASIDRAAADAEIGKPRWAVIAGGNSDLLERTRLSFVLF
jgi:hypothetical protein